MSWLPHFLADDSSCVQQVYTTKQFIEKPPEERASILRNFR